MIVRKWDGEERRESPYFRILQVALLSIPKRGRQNALNLRVECHFDMNG